MQVFTWPQDQFLHGEQMVNVYLKRLAITSIVALSGCSTTYPLYVKNPESGEIFIGKATSQAAGKSSFTIENPDGVVCTRQYKAEIALTYQEGGSSAGTLTCSDGRKGTWIVSGLAGSGGQGVGKLDGKKVIIMYGSIARVSTF